MNRKSQGGSKAATLVAIIMGLIIMYILFMPPSERERLLYNKTINETEGEEVDGGTVNITLLLEHPGRLGYLGESAYEKSIPSLTLYTKTEAAIIKSYEFITVKNNWLTTQTYEFEFSILDLDNTENFVLNFNIKEAKGDLRLELNGKQIYNGEITGANFALKLAKEEIKEKNKIIFSVSSVGLKFWSTNTYELSNIQIIADITDITKQTSRSNFIISTTEMENMESSLLRFYVDCVKKLELDKLEILINNHIVYSQIPICGDNVLQSFDPSILLIGENKIEFRTKFDKPTTAYYNIDNVLIKLELEKPTYPLYSFEISQKRFENIKSGDRKVYLRMLFTEGAERKWADIFVNGRKITTMTVTSREFVKDITGYPPNDLYVKEGSNVIRLEQKTDLEIIDLKVSYE